MGNRRHAAFILTISLGIGCGGGPPKIPETPIAYAPSGGEVYSPKAAPTTAPAPPPTAAPPPPPPPAPSASASASASPKMPTGAKPKAAPCAPGVPNCQ